MRANIHFLTILLAIFTLASCDSKTKTVDACGDGFLDPGEECDTTVGEDSCASLGYYNALGELRCTPDCQLDDSSCGGRCGDGVVQVEEGEECDTTNVNGNSCQNLGYEGGSLTCLEDCTIDVGGCDGACGNGTLESGEACDDGNQELRDGCYECEVLAGWHCNQEEPTFCYRTCGDGVRAEYVEECDGNDFGGNEYCPEGGTRILCTDGCKFDFSMCDGLCGDGVKLGLLEECDGSDLGGQSCHDIPGFDGGVLSCLPNCHFDTSACSELCYVEDNFSPCDPLVEYECCSHNDFPSTCTAVGGDDPVCLQTCVDHDDCGWSLFCSAASGDVCLWMDCGQGSLDGDPCLVGDRPGSCVSVGKAMDEHLRCIEDGTLAAGSTCNLDDVTGQLSIDPAGMCADGLCLGQNGGIHGQCVSFCDALTVYQTHVDPCPAGATCLNTSQIDWNESLDDGSVNPNFNFRTPDQGVCHVWQAGNEIESCDLLTGQVIRGPNPGGPCPAGKVCAVMKTDFVQAWASLIGRCSTAIAYPFAEGTSCGIISGAPEDCAAGLQCFVADPFNTDNDTLACRRFCHAPAAGSITDAEANAACAGLVDGSGNPFVCLTISRFFTHDRELPTFGTGGDQVTETHPSRLGFCVPPPVN